MGVPVPHQHLCLGARAGRALLGVSWVLSLVVQPKQYLNIISFLLPFLFVTWKFRLTRTFDKVLLYMLINPLVSARLTYNLQSLQCLLI